MKITRRNFLKGSLATLFLAGSGIPVYSSTKTKKNLVVIMLRGGMDALCAVPVIGDKDFEKRRKQLILDDTIKLNSDFALHPILPCLLCLELQQESFKYSSPFSNLYGLMSSVTSIKSHCG